MIWLRIYEPTGDALWTRWRRDCDKAKVTIKEQVASGGTPVVKNLYKRKSIKDKFYFGVTGLFGGKCAYCESYLTGHQNPDMEHYRPKLGVTDENDTPVMVDYGNGEVEHRGYYWLAYDWRNLLPSCVKCNQASSIEGEKVGKHNRFPVLGDHALSEDEVPTERPALLNPMEDDPAIFLKVNTSDGMIEAIDPRGEMTIRVLGLNIRDQLRQGRLDKIRAVKSVLVEAIHNANERSQLLSELQAMRDGEGEYTAAVRAMLDELAPVLQGLSRPVP